MRPVLSARVGKAARSPFKLAGWLVAVIALSAPTAYALTTDVHVTNTPAQRVPVTTTPADVAFVQHVALTDSTGSESCMDVTVPAGRTLLIQQITGQASSSLGQQPVVFLRVHYTMTNGFGFVRAPYLRLSGLAGGTGWSAEITTSVAVGATRDARTGNPYQAAAVCVRKTGASTSASFDGFVLGRVG